MKQCQCALEINPKRDTSCPNDSHNVSICEECKRIRTEQHIPPWKIIDDERKTTNIENDELSMPPKVQNILISEFSLDLFSSLEAILDVRKALNELSMILPDLLKEFAIRRGHSAQSISQKDTADYVHRYRTYVIPYYP